MANPNRREFLKRASVGAAAVGALVMAPGLKLARERSAAAGRVPSEAGFAPTVKLTEGAGGPLVAYVRDPARGEVAILVGTEEVVRYDPALVARLLQAVA
jgi:hypothetical protein